MFKINFGAIVRNILRLKLAIGFELKSAKVIACQICFRYTYDRKRGLKRVIRRNNVGH